MARDAVLGTGAFAVLVDIVVHGGQFIFQFLDLAIALVAVAVDLAPTLFVGVSLGAGPLAENVAWLDKGLMTKLLVVVAALYLANILAKAIPRAIHEIQKRT